MAVAATNLVSYGDNTDLTSYSTGSWSPSATTLYLATVTSRITSGAPVHPTLSGNGLTWVEVASAKDGAPGSNIRTTVFRAMAASPSAGALTADFGAETQLGCTILIDELTGTDTSGTNGSGAIIQSAIANGNSGTAPSVTLATLLSGSASFGGLGTAANAAPTAGSGYTSLGETHQGTPIQGTLSEYKATGSVTVDFADPSAGWRIVGVEVAVPAAGANRYLIETSATDGYLLESGSGVLLLEFVHDTVPSVTATDAVALADSVTRLLVLGRSATDSVTRADSATRLLVLGRSATDAVSFGDVATRTIVAGRTATDSVTRSDVATRSVVLGRTASDAVTLSDAATRTATLGRSATDSVTWSDSAAQLKSTSRTATDSVTFADSATRTVTLGRSVTDSVTWADSAARLLGVARSVTDSVTRLDAATRTIGLGRSVTESVTWADSATRLVTIARTLTDSVTWSDSAVRPLNLGRTVTDSVTWADSAVGVKGAASVTRTATESVTWSDSATRLVTLGRSATDSVTLGDAATRAASLGRNATDAVTLSDSASKQLGEFRSATDSVTLSDSATRGIVLGRTGTDGVTFSDAATQSKLAGGITGTAADAVTFSDSATASGGTGVADAGVPRHGQRLVPIGAAKVTAVAGRKRRLHDRYTTDSVTFRDQATAGVEFDDDELAIELLLTV